jgi:hypothetical protein
MATVKYKVCDRCGEKIDGLVSIFFMRPYRFEFMRNDDHFEKELCYKCGNALEDFLKKKRSNKK